MIGQGPANDSSRAQVDDEGEIEPFFTTGDEGDVSSPHLLGLPWQRRVDEQVGCAIAGLLHIVFWLDGDKSLFLYEAAHSIWSAGDAVVGELFFPDLDVLAKSIRYEGA